MPREYPLAFFEMSFLLPSPPARGPGQARHVLHARLQPGVDEPGRHVVDRDAHRRGPGRAPCLPHAGVERDGLVRRLRPAHGGGLGAPRPHEPGDPRRALDRLPPARAPGRAREGGADVRLDLAGARGGRARPGVGGGRVLDRAVLAHRPRREPRHPPLLRVAVSAGREAPHRRVLSLDLRAQRARAPGGGAEGGPDPAPVHAQVRRLSRGGRGVRHSRQAPGPVGAGGGDRGPGDRRPVQGWAPPSASRWTDGQWPGSPRPRASSSSTRGPCATGSGRSTRCRPTRGATSTGPRSTAAGARCCSCPPFACPRSSTPARATPSGSTRSPTTTRCGFTPRTPAASGRTPATS